MEQAQSKIQKLPIKFNIRSEANRKSDFKGIYEPKQLTRLQDIVTSIDSDTQISLSCFYDAIKTPLLTGTASVAVTLTCMRCFKPFPYELNIEFTLTSVRDDAQAANVIDEYTPIIIDEFSEINLLEAIEDELILAVPINPMMNYEVCDYKTDVLIFGDNLDTPTPKDSTTNSPFTALVNLKNNFKKS